MYVHAAACAQKACVPYSDIEVLCARVVAYLSALGT